MSVELPGEMTSRLVPRALICRAPRPGRPAPSPTVRMTALMPMRMPSIVSAERSRWVRTAPHAVRKVSRQVIGPPTRPAAGFDRSRPSLRMRPSRIWIVRSARAATSCSWVISTIVRPLSWSSSKSPSTSAVDVESRLPVGSSARIIAGSVTSARATATRCCWPPESSPGRWSARSARPTVASAASARSRRSAGRTPA